MKYDTPRHRAKAAGLKRYIGLDCPRQHGGERYVASQVCVKCHSAKKQAAKKAKRLANPKKRGRPANPNKPIGPKVWTDEERAKKRAYEREYWARPENVGRRKAKRAKSRAKAELRIPKWLSQKDIEAIKAIYDEAAKRTKETGQVWEVDHIIPINGKNVSGLHVPSNLQVISKEENRKKSNTYHL